MTLSSMTGFARVQDRQGTLGWTWEVRGVNGKSLDLRLRLPPGSDTLDQPVRRLVSERVARGSLSLTLSLDTPAPEPQWRLNEGLLHQAIALAAKARGAGVKPARLDGLLALRGVLEPVAEPPEDEATRRTRETTLLASLAQALEAFQQSRAEEGTRLGTLLHGHLDRLAVLTTEAAATESLRPEAQRERLRRQVADLLALAPDRLPEDRLAQEVALLAVKADVREELDRLQAHIAGARDLLDQGGPIGRRLDFLSQELNREANTLCSKAQDIALTRVGLEMKAVIDQFREQLLNLE
ncbi:YicC/YloC family endoribonuclease [Pararhodospirillum photometricum]|nr:YicC/YloC family endoribonuclease [Pararhodospirillum photometricum]